MNIILIQDVPQLGYKGDLLTVKSGYARNYLIPQTLAIVANESNKKIMAENMKQAGRKLAQAKTNAESMAEKLAAIVIKLKAKTGQSGKIFGSITTLQIAHTLKDNGFEIDRRKISIQEEIKTLGTYHANVELHKDVKAVVTLEVVSDEAAA